MLNSGAGKFASSLFNAQVHSPHDSVAAATGSQLHPRSTLRFKCVLTALSSLDWFWLQSLFNPGCTLCALPRRSIQLRSFSWPFRTTHSFTSPLLSTCTRAFRAQDDKVTQPDTLRFRWEQLEFSEIPAKVSEGGKP